MGSNQDQFKENIKQIANIKIDIVDKKKIKEKFKTVLNLKVCVVNLKRKKTINLKLNFKDILNPLA